MKSRRKGMMNTNEEGLMALEGKCYNCKKVQNCGMFEELVKVYSKGKRSLRRKIQFSIEECEEQEPWEKEEDETHDRQFVC